MRRGPSGSDVKGRYMVMTNTDHTEIREMIASDGAGRALQALLDRLRDAGDYERLFDALLVRARWELGAPLCSPTGFQGVPDEKREALEKAYIEAARTVGQCFLEQGNLPRAWAFYRTIREPEPIARALDAFDPTDLEYDVLNQVIEIALHEGANRVAGLRLLLASHGTCNTITMTDQVLSTLTPDERRRVAAMLTRDVHETLRANLAHMVEKQEGGEVGKLSIAELIAGRDWLFENASYQIDVSHLHATVRFGRALKADDPELPLAIELADYGARLDPQFHYPADPPFDDYYGAHQAYLRAIAGIDVDESLRFFENKLEREPDESDKPILAYVLVDLLTLCGRLERAAEVAAQYLANLEEPNGFSFSALCAEANRWDLLESVAEAEGDPVRYAAALIEQTRSLEQGAVG